jgi:hypothetical protein
MKAKWFVFMVFLSLIVGCGKPSLPGMTGIGIIINPTVGSKNETVISGPSCLEIVSIELYLTGDIPDIVKSTYSSATLQYTGKTEPMILSEKKDYFYKGISDPCKNLFKTSRSEIFKATVFNKLGDEIYTVSHTLTLNP